MKNEKYTNVSKSPKKVAASHVRAPFGYYGAKVRLASRIVSSLPPHNAWVEVFCGSAALTVAKQAVPIEVINDLDDEVVNVFQQLRENSEALCRAIALTPYARSEFLVARGSERPSDPLERARRFLVATMMTVNGTYGSTGAGFSFSNSYTRGGKEARVNRGKEARVNRWYNLPERLARVIERLRNVRIENRDARELLDMFSNRPATLLYLDPPYFARRQHKYVIDADDESFHKELIEKCLRSRCMIFISGYDNALYHSLLVQKGGWTRETIRTKTRDTSGRDYARTEILWKNPLFIKALRTGRVPIRLSAKERKQKKINPRRK